MWEYYKCQSCGKEKKLINRRLGLYLDLHQRLEFIEIRGKRERQGKPVREKTCDVCVCCFCYQTYSLYQGYATHGPPDNCGPHCTSILPAVNHAHSYSHFKINCTIQIFCTTQEGSLKLRNATKFVNRDAESANFFRFRVFDSIPIHSIRRQKHREQLGKISTLH